eukprot:TRINITY_DN5338_c0_g1_i1.p1 TRINITY_DN5338_c0_g1~~TRINITY_DN5338_c0_g1_i1.p1  ORF type:complete len:122 (+),score=12.15 TRINITY_DN5338_c0_g1_i1:29-367(+)
MDNISTLYKKITTLDAILSTMVNPNCVFSKQITDTLSYNLREWPATKKLDIPPVTYIKIQPPPQRDYQYIPPVTILKADQTTKKRKWSKVESKLMDDCSSASKGIRIHMSPF